MVALQRAAGNRAVAALVQQRAMVEQHVPVQRHGREGQSLAAASSSASSRLAATAAGPVGPLGAAVSRAWRIAVRSFGLMVALRVVWDAMVARGEIDPSLVAPAAADPSATRSALVNGFRLAVVGTGGTVGATNLGCRPTAATPGAAAKPMVAINVPENLVNGLFIGDDAARQEAAMITLHSALRHEHRHVQQYAAACGSGEAATGRCHYCNDPDEIDAYLSEIESGRDLPTRDRANAAAHRAELRRSWVRVFVHWEYLAPEQQAVFEARHRAAQTVIDGLFPRMAWASEPEVARYRQQKCDPHGTVDDQRGQCSAPIARSSSIRPEAPPPVSPQRQHLIDLARFFNRAGAFYRAGVQLDDARLGRTLETWQRSLLTAKRLVEGSTNDVDMLVELRRSYRGAVRSLINAAAAHLRQPPASVRRRHASRIDPWGQ